MNMASKEDKEARKSGVRILERGIHISNMAMSTDLELLLDFHQHASNSIVLEPFSRCIANLSSERRSRKSPMKLT